MKIEIGFNQILTITPFDGTEGCGFLTGNTEEITAIVATPSLKPSRFQYSIGFPAWQQMRATAKETGLVIWGTIHSHPDGPLGPSEKDLDIDRRPIHDSASVACARTTTTPTASNVAPAWPARIRTLIPS